MMLRTTALSLLTSAAVILSGAAVAMTLPGANELPAAEQTAPPIQLARGDKQVFIKHGCPYNLDKVCTRSRKGSRLYNCRCVS